MLSRGALTIVDALITGREATPEELTTDTGYTRDHIYQLLDEMIAAGLLHETRRHHNQRVVHITEHPVIEQYRKLKAEFSHVDWPELLTPATVRVCWYLDEPRRITSIADRLGISRQSVHKALSPLKNRAMLSPAGPEYALSDSIQPLLEFIQAVVVHDHQNRARDFAPSTTVEWCDPGRALIRVQERHDTESLYAAEEWEVTGLARFEQFGLQFFLAGEPAFWYAPEETLTSAEIVCHTLVLDSGSRRVSYSLLLIESEAIDRQELTEVAAWYGLADTISEIYRYLDEEYKPPSEGKVHFPSRTEYAALKDQYRVA
jgi:DNA-binding MarR family transcriptional regulator